MGRRETHQQEAVVPHGHGRTAVWLPFSLGLQHTQAAQVRPVSDMLALGYVMLSKLCYENL